MTATATTAALPSGRLRPIDVVRVGVGSLGARAARTVLTALGIAIGIAALVSVVGISSSSRADLLAQLDKFGTNLLEVRAGQSVFGDAATLPEDAPAMIRRIGPVDDVSAVAGLSQTVRRTDLIPASETGGIAVEAATTSLVQRSGQRSRKGGSSTRRPNRYRPSCWGRPPPAVWASSRSKARRWCGSAAAGGP